MKSAIEMIDERLCIQEGYLKGARIKITDHIAKELMEKYHSQFSPVDLRAKLIEFYGYLIDNQCIINPDYITEDHLFRMIDNFFLKDI